MPDLIALSKAGVSTMLAAAITIPALPEHLGLIAISGFGGGVCRFIAEKQRFWPTGLGTIITGIVVAMFLWPVAEPLLEPLLGRIEVDPISRMMFGGFLTGLMGVSLIGLILDFLKAKRGQTDEQSSGR